MSESTEEQKKHGLSVNNQITALQEYCKENGLVEAGLYNDAGISARKSYTKRPALLRLLDDCKAGKIDVIIFTRIDRWFRNIQGYYEVQAQLDECKVAWRAIWEDYETESSEGIFKVNIMLSVSQAEADRTSEKIKSVVQYKRERGDYIGKAPLGYKNKGRELVIDEASKEGMSAFFETYLKTFSIKKAKQEAEKKGVNIDASHIHRNILNPTYCGETRNGYKCEPYITKEQYDLMVNRFASMPRKPKQNRSYMFSGLVYCEECGRRMGVSCSSKTNKKGITNKYILYVCSKRGIVNDSHAYNCIRDIFLENYLLDHLEESYLAQVQQIKMTNECISNSERKKRKSDLEKKLKRLAVLFEEGDIDIDSYREKRDSIKLEMDSIIVEALPAPRPLPENWRGVYSELDDEHKAIFWRKIIDKIIVPVGKNASPIIYFL